MIVIVVVMIVVVLVTMVMSARCGINNNGAKREREGVYWRERPIETIDRMRLMRLYKMQCVGKGEKTKLRFFLCGKFGCVLEAIEGYIWYRVNLHVEQKALISF
jgi:hypothetical protein